MKPIVSALAPHGAWGIMAAAILDSAGLPDVSVDTLIGNSVISGHARWFESALLAVIGSAVGAGILFGVARGGPRRMAAYLGLMPFLALHTEFGAHALTLLFVCAALPVAGLPLKVVVLITGVVGVSLRSFVITIVLARTVHYASVAAFSLNLGEAAPAALVRSRLWFLAVGAVLILVRVAIRAVPFPGSRAKALQDTTA